MSPELFLARSVCHYLSRQCLWDVSFEHFLCFFWADAPTKEAEHPGEDITIRKCYHMCRRFPSGQKVDEQFDILQVVCMV